MKFQVGDKVMLMEDIGANFEDYKVGDIGEVRRTNAPSSTYRVIVNFDSKRETAFRESELELEHIAKSPLYQSLK